MKSQSIIVCMFLVPALPMLNAQEFQRDVLKKQTPEQLERNIERKHPATYYILASKLIASTKKDDAVFWFYVGQLRYRLHLAANPNLAPSGDPALFASLSETVGRPINEYAFGNIPQLVKTIDKALDWDAKHINALTPKDTNAEEYRSVRAGLVKLRDYVIENEAEIKRQRKASGIEK